MIKLIILDIDGVMTDGRKYSDRHGEVKLKTFCDKDWTAIKRFRALGINVIFLTGDPFNVSVATKRNIDVIVNRQDGVHRDKSDYLSEICGEYGVKPEEIVFVGDDIFDLKLLKKVKYSYCPSDAPAELLKHCRVLNNKGGHNLIMELFDHLEFEGHLPKVDIDDHLTDVYDLDLKEKF